ncbi:MULTISPECIES: hypothetical protein [Streptomyces]|uniref:PE domain-containing protein n=1 Tax=Streptomyces rhizosphaericola TaxID=2564098 RepID=A0ABY2P9Q0_9ACTN|nr:MULTISPECIES: hypothetical protein [Streptomyces]MYT96285.1 hypothetical protein [Streptomyces sp. SID8350]TGZ04320.1 hypothetical protein E5Z02_24135 [Streptomyces rhizosphaericola]SCK61404.1 hypothetical protein YUWDRAFT_06121 [Streptomyces sp. AmelKG-D3]
MGQRYYVDPDRIESETRRLEEIGRLARSMAEDFLDELAPTISWPGTNSEFSEKARPQEQKERQIVKDTVLAIEEAVGSITDATVSNVRMMQETRDRNLEEIERNNSRLDTDGLGGSGRYGRR